jgi:hypothetical protein
MLGMLLQYCVIHGLQILIPVYMLQSVGWTPESVNTVVEMTSGGPMIMMVRGFYLVPGYLGLVRSLVARRILDCDEMGVD